MDLTELTSSLLTLYYDVNPMTEKVEVSIIITDNLNRSHCELRPDIREKISKNPDLYNDYNGRMVLPKTLDEPIHILLNSNKIVEYTEDRSMTWVGTFAHEYTHAVDYYQMARLDGLQDYHLLEQTSQYLMFQMWSEYHARKLGYIFLRKALGVDEGGISKEERIQHIMSYEWPEHQKRHYRDYHADTDGNQQIYITMQLLGRYSVWCDLFPDFFNEAAFAKTYINIPWMHRLFSFLRRHETLELVHEKFDVFQEILGENWSWL